MNNNHEGRRPYELAHFGLVFAGFVIGAIGIVIVSVGVAVVGLILVLLGLAYFALQHALYG